MAEDGKVPELKNVEVGFCEPCVLGKQKRVSFAKSGRTPKAKKLELVHTDVYGPTTVASLGGSRYHVTFIDDSTRKIGLKVKSLMSDNGGEYSSDEFKSYCAEFGTRMIKTIPEIPQQNGVAERMNRTLNERVKNSDRDKLDPKEKKCIFIGYGSDDMGYRFWDELTKKVVRSRDVTFNDNAVYKDMLIVDSVFTKEQLEKEEAVLEDITETDFAENSGKAVQVDDSVQWKLAVDEEMSSLEKNESWTLTELPAGKKALQNKWVFKIKGEHDGSKRYKTRLVVKGYQQKKGIDYTDIFSPVVKMTTVRIMLSIVVADELHLEQLDVKTAFLHDDLEEDIYMVQPEGFQVSRKENLVCKLIKSLHGLKQAPRQWYLNFVSFMMKNGYTRSAMDHYCYFKQFDSSYIILLLYVDDMLIAGSNMREINKLKRQMSEASEMKDMGAAKQILVMSIIRDRTEGTLKLSQENYVEKLLQKFSVQDVKTRSIPLVSHFNLTRKQSPKTNEGKKDMAKVTYASAVGGLMKRALGSSQVVVTLLERHIQQGDDLVEDFLEELGKKQADSALYSDSQSDIHLAKNPVFHVRTKHIQLRYHFTRELISNGTLSLKKILGSKNPADMLTKTYKSEVKTGKTPSGRLLEGKILPTAQSSSFWWFKLKTDIDKMLNEDVIKKQTLLMNLEKRYLGLLWKL
ncbi:hypothetical protein AgCh_021912 [Apium graveolens]